MNIDRIAYAILVVNPISIRKASVRHGIVGPMEANIFETRVDKVEITNVWIHYESRYSQFNRTA